MSRNQSFASINVRPLQINDLAAADNIFAVFFSTPFPDMCSFFCVQKNRNKLFLFLMQVYQANSDKASIVTNKFSSPRSAEWISIAPTSWSSCIALRLEVYGY